MKLYLQVYPGGWQDLGIAPWHDGHCSSIFPQVSYLYVCICIFVYFHRFFICSKGIFTLLLLSGSTWSIVSKSFHDMWVVKTKLNFSQSHVRWLPRVFYFWLARQKKPRRNASEFHKSQVLDFPTVCHIFTKMLTSWPKFCRDLIRTVRTLTNDAQFSSFKQVPVKFKVILKLILKDS